MAQEIRPRQSVVRVVVDTNVLFSALFYPSTEFALMIEHLVSEHDMLVPDYIANELRRKALQKRPEQAVFVDGLLQSLGVETPEEPLPHASHIRMRDSKDQPILNAAISADVDVIITGDKDFIVLDIDRPKVMTPREFIEEFIHHKG